FIVIDGYSVLIIIISLVLCLIEQCISNNGIQISKLSGSTNNHALCLLLVTIFLAMQLINLYILFFWVNDKETFCL
ncbi:hypothetical protein ACJX0J_019391, partial [Zea mays]